MPSKSYFHSLAISGLFFFLWSCFSAKEAKKEEVPSVKNVAAQLELEGAKARQSFSLQKALDTVPFAGIYPMHSIGTSGGWVPFFHRAVLKFVGQKGEHVDFEGRMGWRGHLILPDSLKENSMIGRNALVEFEDSAAFTVEEGFQVKIGEVKSLRWLGVGSVDTVTRGIEELWMDEKPSRKVERYGTFSLNFEKTQEGLKTSFKELQSWLNAKNREKYQLDSLQLAAVFGAQKVPSFFKEGFENYEEHFQEWEYFYHNVLSVLNHEFWIVTLGVKRVNEADYHLVALAVDSKDFSVVDEVYLMGGWTDGGYRMNAGVRWDLEENVVKVQTFYNEYFMDEVSQKFMLDSSWGQFELHSSEGFQTKTKKRTMTDKMLSTFKVSDGKSIAYLFQKNQNVHAVDRRMENDTLKIEHWEMGGDFFELFDQPLKVYAGFPMEREVKGVQQRMATNFYFNQEGSGGLHLIEELPNLFTPWRTLELENEEQYTTLDRSVLFFADSSRLLMAENYKTEGGYSSFNEFLSRVEFRVAFEGGDTTYLICDYLYGD